MPSEYTGNGSGITAGQAAVILCPIDSDAPNSDSVNVPLQALANLIDFLMRNAGLLGVENNFTPIQTFSNGIHCGGSRITGVVDPIADGDAATKHYVDGVAGAGGISNSCGGSAYFADTYGDIANMAVNATFRGDRPVLIMVVPDGSANTPSGISVLGASENLSIQVRCMRDGSTTVAETTLTHSGAVSRAGDGAVFQCVDFPSAGSHTYTIQALRTGGTTGRFQYCRLFVRELL